MQFIECLDRAGLVEIQLATTVALSFLVANAQSEGDQLTIRALDCLYKNAVPDSELREKLPWINSRIISLQKKAGAMNNPLNKLIAGGLPIWLTSFRSLSAPEVFPYGRRIWTVLSKGDSVEFMHGMREIVSFLGAHPLADILERFHLFEVPAFFVTDPAELGLEDFDEEEFSEKPSSCPVCGGLRIAEIIYGYPDFTETLERDIDQGRVVLGGCIPSESKWQCLTCAKRIPDSSNG
ncbi:hypothetical protein NK553_25720 [Pseudomonas sp. ZM23]|uniref:Uncharacterized protein n=1 Tax=Pseudomonas triclosanedens TaxID=2961893 RepID=A0ABY6ZWC6_9PSED|nr:hypothetical protein [Pseudomonas triclosanedens]MCP8467355.1 hypothetical protein [Pseudomonas triclosanedens]MCP8469945.1 hypothetical protein [Pseudomonas triclosanedens]MCP8478744.1 hypothetical protein [Pseudomonas triclosanedens]WAI49272.1 hypothetical protein OU419_26600 [Pseudomonas triclosanedens]